jgi:hypothetical protein
LSTWDLVVYKVVHIHKRLSDEEYPVHGPSFGCRISSVIDKLSQVIHKVSPGLSGIWYWERAIIVAPIHMYHIRRGKIIIAEAAPNEPPNSNSSISPSMYLGSGSAS